MWEHIYTHVHTPLCKRIFVEGIVHAIVAHIVHYGREQQRQTLNVGQEPLSSGGVQQVVNGL